MRCLFQLGLLGTAATLRRGRAVVEGGPDSTRSPELAVVECGDLSPLLRRRLVAVELPCGSGHAGAPALARAVNAPFLAEASRSSVHPEVVGEGQGRAGGGGPQGARHLCRFSVRRAGRVRMRCDVRTVKRRERRAPTAPAALRRKCRRSGARRS